jgi:hypothetical protein
MMQRQGLCALLAASILALAFSAPARGGSELAALLAVLRKVDAEGKGNERARSALRELADAANAGDLLPILEAMDSCEVRATNLIRVAGDMVMDKISARGDTLPLDKLEAFLLDTKHVPSARRTAYEWLLRADPKVQDRLVPKFLNDPAAELRRDAIALEIKKAKEQTESDPEAAKKALLAAFEPARDSDQVLQISVALQKLGHKVDLPGHLGMIEKWQLIGPFDNTDMKGFEVAYPPEKTVDLAAKLKGKKDAEIAWSEHQVQDPQNITDLNRLGIVDFNKAIGKNMGVVGYAMACVDSRKEQPVEVRVGSFNAVKVFLNGKQVIAHEEYHHPAKMDQYVGKGTLKAGRNEILVKVCQNEQTEAWAQSWNFQLRLCDALGAAVPFEIVKGTKTGEEGRP